MTTRTTDVVWRSATAALLALSIAAAASAQPQPVLHSVLSRIRSTSAEDRRAAVVQLRNERKAAIQELVNVVSAARARKSGPAGDAVHLAILTLGEWNATEAQPLLLEMIDYRVALKSGAKYEPGSEYPAALALTKMAAADITSDVATRLAQETSPVRRRLMTWVLYRTRGEGGAAEVLDAAIGRAGEAEVSRLRTAREELKSGNQLVYSASVPR